MSLAHDEARERYVAMMDTAWQGRMCVNGTVAHDAFGKLDADDIRSLRDLGVANVLYEAPASWETDPDDPDCIRDREGPYDPELGYWQFLVEHGGSRFVITSRETGSSFSMVMLERVPDDI